MALLTDLGQRAKSVRQLVVWLEKNGNYQALDILECKGKLILIRLVSLFNFKFVVANVIPLHPFSGSLL